MRKTEILVGERFGEMTVIGAGQDPTGKPGGNWVIARCDCGVEKHIRLKRLRARTSLTCGRAAHFDREIIAKGDSMIGSRFGLLVVIAGTATRDSNAQALVRCDCGAERYAIIDHLLRGNIASCGGEAHKTISVQARRWTWSGKPSTYAIEAVGTGLIKIGSARDVKERLLKLQYTCPVELRVIAVSEQDVERRLHAELVAHRAHGEWFRMNEQVMAAVLAVLAPSDLSVLVDIGTGSRGQVRGRKYTCKRCGGSGHFAKTCSRPIPQDVGHHI